MRDIVGLYLAPPDRALVLCVDEKSQVQALDRTADANATGPDRKAYPRFHLHFTPTSDLGLNLVER